MQKTSKIEQYTKEDLYEHNYALFAALIRVYDSYITPLGATAIRAWKSKFHADGSICEGYFIAGLGRRNINGTQLSISYHLPLKWWDKIRCIERDRAPEYIKHSSADIIEELSKL